MRNFVLKNQDNLLVSSGIDWQNIVTGWIKAPLLVYNLSMVYLSILEGVPNYV